MLGGECKIIPKADYVVLGKTDYDQNFVDEVVATGVAQCGYAAPQERPAEWDQPAAKPKAASPAPPAVAKRRTILDRLRRVKPPVAGTVEPVQPSAQISIPAGLPQVGQPLPEPTPAPTPAVVKPTRLPADELLDPT